MIKAILFVVLMATGMAWAGGTTDVPSATHTPAEVTVDLSNPTVEQGLRQQFIQLLRQNTDQGVRTNLAAAIESGEMKLEFTPVPGVVMIDFVARTARVHPVPLLDVARQPALANHYHLRVAHEYAHYTLCQTSTDPAQVRLCNNRPFNEDECRARWADEYQAHEIECVQAGFLGMTAAGSSHAWCGKQTNKRAFGLELRKRMTTKHPECHATWDTMVPGMSASR